MGYRFSVQESTKYSPYHLLFGMKPLLPSTTSAIMDPELDVSIGDICADAKLKDRISQDLLNRGKAMQNAVAIAAGNLETAQHRDQARYAMTRSGTYLPQVRKFEEGSFVYTQKTSGKTTLEPKARHEILKVLKVGELGTLTLQGKCGGTVRVNAINCAPCHLPGIDGTIDWSLGRPDKNLPCELCKMPDHEDSMLLCDECNKGFHMACLNPPLSKVPKGAWFCPNCQTAAGPASPDPELCEEDQLDGLQVRCPKSHAGKHGNCEGTIKSQGPGRQLQVVFRNGQSMTVTKRMAKNWLIRD